MSTAWSCCPRQSTRTAAEPGGPRFLPAQVRFAILQSEGFRCRYCRRSGSTPRVVLRVDRVVPQAAGGATSEDNLLTACEECNLGKGARAVVPAG